MPDKHGQKKSSCGNFLVLLKRTITLLASRFLLAIYQFSCNARSRNNSHAVCSFFPYFRSSFDGAYFSFFLLTTDIACDSRHEVDSILRLVFDGTIATTSVSLINHVTWDNATYKLNPVRTWCLQNGLDVIVKWNTCALCITWTTIDLRPHRYVSVPSEYLKPNVTSHNWWIEHMINNRVLVRICKKFLNQ